MVGCRFPWLGRYWGRGSLWEGRDVVVVSMVLTRTIVPKKNEKTSKNQPHNPPTPIPNVRTIDTTPTSWPPINYPFPNTYSTREIYTPPFIDPLDVPLNKLICNT